MKNIFAVFLLIIFSCNGIVSAQAVSVNAGYAVLKMENLNSLIDNYARRSEFYGINADADKISGGLAFSGSFKFSINKFVIGIEEFYIASTGTFNSSEADFKHEENYDVSTHEITAIVEYPIQKFSSNLIIFARVNTGIGFAKAEYNGFINNDIDQETVIRGELSHNYFAGKFQIGLLIPVGKFGVEILGGYRWAKAGALSGKIYRNNQYIKNDVLTNSFTYQPVKFDFSGILSSIGLQYNF